MKKFVFSILLFPFLSFALMAAKQYQVEPPVKNIPAISMADPTVDIPPALAMAVKTALENGYGYLPATNLSYAITHYQQQANGVFLVSVAGLDFTRKAEAHVVGPDLPELSEQAKQTALLINNQPGVHHWNLQAHGVWFGMVIVQGIGGKYQGAVKGTQEFTNALLQNGLSTALDYTRYGLGLEMMPPPDIPIQPHIFPWLSGTDAYYGLLGIHANGFSNTPDWVAVDFVGGPFMENSMPNMVYAANAGTIEYICEDDTQIAARTNNLNMYTHLNKSVDVGDLIGRELETGEAITGMVVGSFTDTCGYADQQAANWHVHFGFPDYGTWPFESYTLSTVDGIFYGWEDQKEPGDVITANWDIPNPPPPPIVSGEGHSIWDFLVEGVVTVAQSLIPILGDHEATGLAANILIFASVPMELLYWMSLTYIDMTWIITVFLIILVGESIKFMITIWFGIKKVIPGLAT